MVLDDDYPEIFALLVSAGERAFTPFCASCGLTEPGTTAADLAFDLAEYVRTRLGGTYFRLIAYQDEPEGDLFGAAPLAVPEKEPEVPFTSTGGNNVDLVAFVRLAAVWLLARRIGASDAQSPHATATLLARMFHAAAAGRDQRYIPKGQSFDNKAKCRRLWDSFNGHNYAKIALQEGLTEMRVRQIIKAFRKSELRRRQPPLFDPT